MGSDSGRRHFRDRHDGSLVLHWRTWRWARRATTGGSGGTCRGSAGHPFYERLNRILEAAGFNAFVEELCARFYARTMGRPNLAPGRCFRLLLLGYFEGLDSERAIAWREA